MAKMKPDDPVHWMLFDGFESTPNPDIYNPECYICTDPEYAQMGLPLCKPCFICGKHVPADNNVCDDGHEQPGSYFDELVICVESDKPISKSLFLEVSNEFARWFLNDEDED